MFEDGTWIIWFIIVVLFMLGVVAVGKADSGGES